VDFSLPKRYPVDMKKQRQSLGCLAMMLCILAATRAWAGVANSALPDFYPGLKWTKTAENKFTIDWFEEFPNRLSSSPRTATLPGQSFEAKSQKQMDVLQYYGGELSKRGYQPEQIVIIGGRKFTLLGMSADGPSGGSAGSILCSSGTVRVINVSEHDLNPDAGDEEKPLPPNYVPGPFVYRIFISDLVRVDTILPAKIK